VGLRFARAAFSSISLSVVSRFSCHKARRFAAVHACPYADNLNCRAAKISNEIGEAQYPRWIILANPHLSHSMEWTFQKINAFSVEHYFKKALIVKSMSFLDGFFADITSGIRL
jgi:hypothetical protein